MHTHTYPNACMHVRVHHVKHLVTTLLTRVQGGGLVIALTCVIAVSSVPLPAPPPNGAGSGACSGLEGSLDARRAWWAAERKLLDCRIRDGKTIREYKI